MQTSYMSGSSIYKLKNNFNLNIWQQISLKLYTNKLTYKSQFIASAFERNNKYIVSIYTMITLCFFNMPEQCTMCIDIHSIGYGK